MTSSSVERLSKSFGGLQAVADLSRCRCRRDPGIIGPNGAGKTTAVNLVSRDQADQRSSTLVKRHRPGAAQRSRVVWCAPSGNDRLPGRRCENLPARFARFTRA
jgi:ABC-type branched-subunit amino acid transport system ATPase component